jgi:hypothetical protein
MVNDKIQNCANAVESGIYNLNLGGGSRTIEVI